MLSQEREYFLMTSTLLQANIIEKVVTVPTPRPAKIKWGAWTSTFAMLYKGTSVLLLSWCQESLSKGSGFDPHQPVKKTPQPTQVQWRPYGMSEHPLQPIRNGFPSPSHWSNVKGDLMESQGFHYYPAVRKPQYWNVGETIWGARTLSPAQR